MHRGESNSPLHFAAAASWLAGVEALISLGYSRFRKDGNGECPIQIAINANCIPTVKVLLAGDCLEFLADGAQYCGGALPYAIIKVAESDNPKIHDVVIECLLRHKLLLPKLLPFRDLAARQSIGNLEFAQKLFVAGFRDIDVYDDSGNTPLTTACAKGNINMASFLIQHGADPNKCHKYAGLRAGHFLCYETGSFWSCSEISFQKANDSRTRDVEKRLLEAAFDSSIDVGTRCRCSPDGFSPVTYLLLVCGYRAFYANKESLKELIRHVSPSATDTKKYWRALVIGEIFTRLGMTHTCLKSKPKLQPFPDNDRIGIENDEEDLFFQLQEIVARFDFFSVCGEEIAECVDMFFDDLDGDLRPQSSYVRNWTCSEIKSDCLGPGRPFSVRQWTSSRGHKIRCGHKETVKEESMLRWLF